MNLCMKPIRNFTQNVQRPQEVICISKEMIVRKYFENHQFLTKILVIKFGIFYKIGSV